MPCDLSTSCIIYEYQNRNTDSDVSFLEICNGYFEVLFRRLDEIISKFWRLIVKLANICEVSLTLKYTRQTKAIIWCFDFWFAFVHNWTFQAVVCPFNNFLRLEPFLIRWSVDPVLRFLPFDKSFLSQFILVPVQTRAELDFRSLQHGMCFNKPQTSSREKKFAVWLLFSENWLELKANRFIWVSI